MKRETFLVLLGVLVMLSPFAGLPLSWLVYILPLLGLLVVIIGVSLRQDQRRRDASLSVPHESPAQILPQ